MRPEFRSGASPLWSVIPNPDSASENGSQEPDIKDSMPKVPQPDTAGYGPGFLRSRIICLSKFLLLQTLSASAEDVNLQAVVPGEAGTIALRVTLDEGVPAVMENSSGLSPEPSAVPEPVTLGLLGLGVLGLAGLRKKRQAR